MRQFLTISAALFALHCSNPPAEAPPAFAKCEDYYDDSFCQDEGNRIVLVDQTIIGPHREALLKGLEAWHNKTKHIVKFEVRFVPESELIDDAVTPRTIYVWNSNPSDPTLAGAALWDPRNGAGLVHVRPDTPDEVYQLAFTHEIGHTLNLGHYEGHGWAIMSLNNLALELTCVDVEAFCNVWHCNLPCRDPGPRLDNLTSDVTFLK